MQVHDMKLDPWSIKMAKVKKKTDETGNTFTTTLSLEHSHVLTVD